MRLETWCHQGGEPARTYRFANNLQSGLLGLRPCLTSRESSQALGWIGIAPGASLADTVRETISVERDGRQWQQLAQHTGAYRVAYAVLAPVGERAQGVRRAPLPEALSNVFRVLPPVAPFPEDGTPR